MNLHLVWSTSVNQKIVSSQSSPSYSNIPPPPPLSSFIDPRFGSRPMYWTDRRQQQLKICCSVKKKNWLDSKNDAVVVDVDEATDERPSRTLGSVNQLSEEMIVQSWASLQSSFFRHARWKIQPSLAENETNNVGSVTGISNYKFF